MRLAHRSRHSLLVLAAAAISLSAQAPLKYPETRKSGQVDDFFGTSVADPYRWLENTNDPEVHDWITAENVPRDDPRAHDDPPAARHALGLRPRRRPDPPREDLLL
jgi:hypothetical protein